jgi:hypothetical protein
MVLIPGNLALHRRDLDDFARIRLSGCCLVWTCWGITIWMAMFGTICPISPVATSSMWTFL